MIVVVTARKRSLRRLCFYICLSFCSQGEGVCLSACWDTPPGAETPGSRHPREQTPPRQTAPRSRHHPPGADTTPQEQTSPKEQTPQWSRHLPGSRHPPKSRHTPGSRHTPSDTVHAHPLTGNKWAVCILLECKLVYHEGEAPLYQNLS